MKKIELGQAIAILANFGVIVGIAFVAVEISQNNDQLAAQTKSTIWELRDNLERDLINNVGGLADLRGKERRGETLTNDEASRLQRRRFHMLRTFEYMVQASPENAIAHAPYMSAQFVADPVMLEVLNNFIANDLLDSQFETFVETNVLPGLD